MVQEEKACYYAVRAAETRDPAAKKAGYDAVRRAEAERQRQLQADKEKKAQEQAKHGSWGPVFKNRQNFNSMHIC